MKYRLYTRDGVFYVDIRHADRRERRSLNTTDPGLADRRAAALAGRVEDPPQPARPIDQARRLQRIRERSRRRGHECLLSADELDVLIRRAGGRCEVSGIPFSDWKRPGWDKPPFALTIDRINNRLPYSLGNCRVVCQAVNVALNEWGDDVLRMIAEGTCALLATSNAA